MFGMDCHELRSFAGAWQYWNQVKEGNSVLLVETWSARYYVPTITTRSLERVDVFLLSVLMIDNAKPKMVRKGRGWTDAN